MIRFISFDLWLTLIKSNPLFKHKRAELIADKYNPKGFSSQTIFTIVQNVDRDCDRLNEVSGNKLATELMISSLLIELGFRVDLINPSLISEIKDKVNELFSQYQPMLLNDNIIQMLVQLKKDGYLLNVSSNTGFIEGKYLIQSEFLKEIFSFFDFFVFSDEINASKPSVVFYEHVFSKMDGEKREVLHIGDNYFADYVGAQKYGFHALFIENRDYSLKLIKSTIDAKNRKF